MTSYLFSTIQKFDRGVWDDLKGWEKVMSSYRGGGKRLSQADSRVVNKGCVCSKTVMILVSKWLMCTLEVALSKHYSL